MLDALGKGQDLPANTVSITFDDACRTIYTEAFPRLRKRNWPFTLFASFERTNLSVRVTTVGEEILRHARQMMEQADAIRSLSAAQRDSDDQPSRATRLAGRPHRCQKIRNSQLATNSSDDSSIQLCDGKFTGN